MNRAEARALDTQHRQAPIELRPTELDDLERLSVDELTALLQRRFRRFLACGCDYRQALLLAVGLA
jgi:hypothetical protein